MTPAEYMDAAKAKLGIDSDYKLLQMLGDDPRYTTGYREGKRPIKLATRYKLAMVLEMDPAKVVADLEAQHEKNEQQAEFFRGFLKNAPGIAARLSLYGLISAVILHVSKLLELAQLST